MYILYPSYEGTSIYLSWIASTKGLVVQIVNIDRKI